MQVMSVYDLPANEAYDALRYLRSCYAPHSAQSPVDRVRDREQYGEVLKMLGGRTSFLLRVAKAHDMMGKFICIESRRCWTDAWLGAEEARNMVADEKEWLLSRSVD